MGRLAEILSLSRKNDMNIQSFWQHMRRLILYAKQNGVIPPGDIIFTQPICSMNLSNSQRHIILAHFENTQSPKTVTNLRNISVKLLGSFSPSNPQSAFVSDDIEEGNTSDAALESEFGNGVLYAKSKPKSKSRPCAEDLAFKRSENVLPFRNSPSLPRETHAAFPAKNDPGTPPFYGADPNVDKNNRCLRCGSRGHFWKTCPHPFRQGKLSSPSVHGEDLNLPITRGDKKVFASEQSMIY